MNINDLRRGLKVEFDANKGAIVHDGKVITDWRAGFIEAVQEPRDEHSTIMIKDEHGRMWYRPLQFIRQPQDKGMPLTYEEGRLLQWLLYLGHDEIEKTLKRGDKVPDDYPSLVEVYAMAEKVNHHSGARRRV